LLTKKTIKRNRGDKSRAPSKRKKAWRSRNDEFTVRSNTHKKKEGVKRHRGEGKENQGGKRAATGREGRERKMQTVVSTQERRKRRER